MTNVARASTLLIFGIACVGVAAFLSMAVAGDILARLALCLLLGALFAIAAARAVKLANHTLLIMMFMLVTTMSAWLVAIRIAWDPIGVGNDVSEGGTCGTTDAPPSVKRCGASCVRTSYVLPEYRSGRNPILFRVVRSPKQSSSRGNLVFRYEPLTIYDNEGPRVRWLDAADLMIDARASHPDVITKQATIVGSVRVHYML